MKFRGLMAALALTMISGIAHAQAGASLNNAVGIWGQDTETGLPCLIAPAGGSATCAIPTGIVATGDTFVDAAIGTIGQAPPVGGDNISIVVAGVMRSWSGVNPSGSVYMGSVDLGAIGGTTVLRGNGVAGNGTQRVVVASDNTPFHVIVDGSVCGLCSTAAKQDAQTVDLDAIAASVAGATPAGTNVIGHVLIDSSALPTGASTAAKQDTGNTTLATIAGRAAPNTYLHIAASTTTSVAATFLHTVCVNSLGTVASTVTIEDAASDTTPVVGVVNSLAFLGCVTYDVALSTGLTVKVSGTVAPDVTVSYR